MPTLTHKSSIPLNLSCHVTQCMDCLISQDVVTASHSTCMLKFLLHLSSDEKIKNKVTEHCKVRSSCSAALYVSFFYYKNVVQNFVLADCQ